nr:uncharacterized mitochondrial protein AtMg00810-like [Tanacetum cinerariifolium]
MRDLTFFLGLQVKQSKKGIFISQDKYVANILKKFDFSSIKTPSTPIETQKPLVKDEEAADVDVYLYRSMIRSLMYLMASRPDIMFAVCACSRFQVTPKLLHLQAVKRIFMYLKGQPKVGLWYPKDYSFNLEAYSDSDYAGANLDRKSTTRGCQFLGRRLISWQCKKQTIVATSTTKAGYVPAANYYGQNTATSKTVNLVKQIHVIVDGKAVVISESSVRSDLLFNDEDEVNTSGSGEDIMEHPDDLMDYVPPTPHDSPLSRGHTPRSDEENASKQGSNDDKTEELNLTDEANTKRYGKPPRLTRSTTTLQPLPTIDPKVKGKGVLVEEETEKLEKEKRRDPGVGQSTKGKTKVRRSYYAALTKEFDEIQARIDADHERTVRMTHEEQEKYTIKERARLLAEYFKRRKKQLAAERADAIRNKPPTRTQVRNMMITYLKHMGNYTHQQLKHKTFEELQKLYQKEKKWINDLVPMDSKKEEKKSVEPESKGKKGKRIKRSDKEESTDYEHENEELEMWLIVVLDEEETVDPEILSTKLVMKRFKGNTSEGYNLLLWGDLKVMFEPNAEDEIWKKRYPLIKEMLEKMLHWKLEAEAKSTMAFELLKFIKSQIEE